MATVGFLILGQTPRPDIEHTYRQYLPDAEFFFAGALDDLDEDAIEELTSAPKTYPLLAWLNDNSSREIDMMALLPRLECQAEKLKAAGAQVLVLMCAGQFPDLNVDIPVIYPQRIVQAITAGISTTKRLRIISPNPGQLPVALQNWQDAGFSVCGLTASHRDKEALTLAVTRLEKQPERADCLVLDCMGFTPESVSLAKQFTDLPVLCPQRMVAKVVGELLNC